jgi:hypothetical protein
LNKNNKNIIEVLIKEVIQLKNQNKNFAQQNEEIKEENKILISGLIKDNNNAIEELKKEVNQLKNQYINIITKNEEIKEDHKKLKEENKHINEELKKEVIDQINQRKIFIQNDKKIVDNNLPSKNEMDIIEESPFKEIKYSIKKLLDFKLEKRTIMIENNYMNDDNLTYLNDFLSSNNYDFERIYFRNNNLGDNPKELDKILSLIKKCKAVTHIGFINENIGSNVENIRKICIVLNNLDNLRNINFYCNDLGRNIMNMTVLADFLSKNIKIYYLNLGNNDLGNIFEENLTELLRGLSHNKILFKLILKNNNFTSYNDIFESFGYISSLEEIDLKHNEFTNEALFELKELQTKFKNIYGMPIIRF